ncbi:50S ribosomal protein L18a, partial [Candidatus Bathyarchaeota archaeon]|nr:50S ribosomal protein L18a [Candidatus Bathyarchaeota archaeon]
MSEVKVFRVTGKMVKPNLKTTFRKEVRALKPEDAKEKIFMELGSKHRAKRFQI